MKKYLLTNVKIILVGVILAVGFSYVSASSWVNPPGGAPSGNTAFPVDISSSNQTKAGDLSVYTFLANKNASFGGDLFLQGVVRGNSASIDCPGGVCKPSTVAIGDAAHTVSTTINGLLTVDKDEAVKNLANGAPSNNLPHICSDTNGNIIFCTPPAKVDLCSNIAGDQYSLPKGYWRNEDGTCSSAPDFCSNIPGNQWSVPTGYTQQANNTCIKTDNITASPSIARDCDADRPDHGGFFDTLAWYTIGQAPGFNNTGTRGARVTDGTYDLKLNFNQPVEEPVQMSFKVCTAHPNDYSHFLGPYSTYFDSYYSCELNTADEFLGQDEDGIYPRTYVNGKLIPRYHPDAAGYQSMLNDSDTHAYTVTIQPGASSVTIPNLYCSRAGEGDKLKWATINPNAWGVTFKDLGNPIIQSNLTLGKPVDPPDTGRHVFQGYLCTHEDTDGNKHCEGE